uniref:Uncharacterized protein n=1 Tax=Haptolina brevifila TaxID=156173 RepID=A0A7S2CL39_9EUKA|mmetsp:Transcript_25331/g.50931  ORF Transcript_25331/g.50931 Transcript_25331/m.50931 type:complete len:215 (+) Transcript_25331:101-745(+)|eukprot:CAMPEP_0174731016 /NCGR_PEP_ID=MMETSP1094-20130205/56720_1 /TAXON_ID=156173 /ORGANISM="Chrysochromulina brevifilum, Strain UTEX LB 985" /LENGTH=214 /DNA_ID=CAMNT_0015933359 /DNA_START=23 /DNA_END=667 /DNA_ORIENTATION=+
MGFTVEFFIPFPKEDVWREMNAAHQLGVSTQVKIAFVGSGAAEDGSSSIPVGAVRRVTTDDSTVTSRATCVVENEYIEWEILSQVQTRIKVYGANGANAFTSVRIEDRWLGDHNASGTTVTLGYDFAKITSKDMLFGAEAHFKNSLSHCADTWTRDMKQRGYTAIAGMAPAMGKSETMTSAKGLTSRVLGAIENGQSNGDFSTTRQYEALPPLL